MEARRCGKAGQAGHRPRLSLDCGKKDSKVRVLSRKTSFCPRLLEQGFAGHHLAIAVGVRLGPKDAQAKRLKEARVRLQRIDLLPSSIQLKAQLVASLAIGEPGRQPQRLRKNLLRPSKPPAVDTARLL